MTLQCNLHQHTEGSFLDGEARAAEVIDRAVDLGMDYVAFTDHGECNQHLAGAKAAEAAGIGFIPGMEGYWMHAEEVAWHREQKGRDRRPYPSHICLLAMTDEGLSNLWALSSMAYEKQYFDYKPIATPELMATYAEGIWASDGCMMTKFADAVIAERDDKARQLLGTLRHIYRDRFYMELHTWQFMQPIPHADHPNNPHCTGGDEKTECQQCLNEAMTLLNKAKVRFAQELSVPLVVVNDSHHATPEHWINKEYVWAFNTSDNSDKLAANLEVMAQKADHLMGEGEIHQWMARHEIPCNVVDEAIKNSHWIAQQCRVEIKPTLSAPRLAESEADDLRDLLAYCEEGFKRHVTDAGKDESVYFPRLEEELRLISDKNFAGYFNVVRDYVLAYRSGAWSQYVRNDPRATKNPLLIGPGRGSVGGSLVAYLIGIDIIDPVKYGTLFSRFLSPGRKGLPDIDVDVPQSQRPEALDYLQARFQRENTCIIGTLNRNGPKQTLRDLARALKITERPEGRTDIDTISQHIEEVERLRDPNDPDAGDLTYAELVERKGHELAPYASKYPKLFEHLGEMTGLARHSGVHPAGILISTEPLLGRVPLRRTKKKVLTTQLDMWEVEFLGGVKLDLLGIRHLDTLSHARRLIYERHGVWIDYDRSGLSTPRGCSNVLTFTDEMFADEAIWPQIDVGQTLGIFQVETSNCTQAAIEFKPRSEVDVADLTSIIRPGVADAGLKEPYLRRRAMVEPVTYDHPLMESIVGPKWSTNTHGILVYQEQIIECVQLLAGFTADEADDLRKALGKKFMDRIVAFKQKFVTGCMASKAYMSSFAGQPTENAKKVSEKIWTSIEAAGRYAFNWSHAVGYAIIASWEVWTKHHYPQEFLVALMATDSASINRYIREARRRKIIILPPDINKSSTKFTIEGEAIRYGIDTVHGVGAVSCRGIMAGRPYGSLEDYLSRSMDGSDKTVVQNLIHIGAFDGMGTREDMLERLRRYRAARGLADSTLVDPDRLEKVVTRRLQSGNPEFAIEVPDFADPKVMYDIEKKLVGTYVTVDPMERYVETLDQCALRDPFDMMAIPRGNRFTVGGQLTSIRPTVTKRGRTPGAAMAHLTVQWNEADFKVTVWPEQWAMSKDLLELGAPVALRVRRLDNGCCLEQVIRLDQLFDREGLP
jgi:DNA polymerase-3 subunit alpha